MAQSEGASEELVPTEDGPERGVDDGAPVVVYVDSHTKRGNRVKDRLNGDIVVSVHSDIEAARDALGPTVSVLLVTAGFDVAAIETLVGEARRVAPLCHVGLLAEDRETLREIDVPRDEELTRPLPWGDFVDTVASLLVRAQYLAGLQRFYKQSLALNTRRIELKDTDPNDDERFRQIAAELSRLEGRLDALAEQFTPAEYQAVVGRIQAGAERSLGEGKPVTNPNVFGLPEECPSCGLPFGHWHGHNLGHGFERIAANVWRCTECDMIFDNPDPSDRRIARR